MYRIVLVARALYSIIRTSHYAYRTPHIIRSESNLGLSWDRENTLRDTTMLDIELLLDLYAIRTPAT